MSQTLQNQLLLAKSMNGIIEFNDGQGTTISNGQIVTNGVNADAITTNTLSVPSLSLTNLTVTGTANVPTVSPLGDYSNKAVNTQYLTDYFIANQAQDAYLQFPLGAPIGNIAPTVIHNYLSPSTTSIKMPNETLLPYEGFRYIIYPDRQWSSLSSSVPITTITGSTFVFNGQIVSSITMNVNNSFLEIMCINLSGSGVCWSVIRKDPNSLLSSVNTWTNTNTFSVSPIIKNQYLNFSSFVNTATLTITGTIYPVYCLAPPSNMTITLPTASATYDGAVINFFRTGGTNTLTINSASSNIYNNALTLTNVILLSRQYSRSIICQANNGVYAWYYADSDSILYSANTWYGANTYTVNPTFASNRQLYYLDAVNNVIGVGNSTSTAGTNNLYCGTQSGAGNTASYNACYGFQTLSRGGTLQGFCVFGYRSGADFVSGSLNNVAIGIFSGLGAVNGDSECTYIGNGSGSDGLARYDNSIAIGRYAKVFASNVLVFGGTDGIYGYPVSYFMGGCVVPATKNLNLLGCFISATQSFLVNSSTISLTGGKTIYVGSAVTELFLPLPSASDVGKIFTIVKNGSGGGTLWGLALRRPTLTTFTISANGFNGNTAYSMGVSEFSVDIMVIGSTAAGVCYTIIYNNPDLIRTETVFSSAFFLPPQSVVPATRSQINTIVIGQDALITVTSSTHSLSNTVIGTAAGKLIQSTPAALTIIGREAYGQATNLGSGCSSLGYRSGWDITTGASTNLTMIGTTTSVSSPTTAYNQSSCFGFGSTITRSNECVLATASETVYVPGTLQAQNNYIASASPTLITTTTTLSGVLYRYYSITTDGGSYSITLPTASVSYLGCSVTFRRVGSNSNNTLTSASSNIYQRNIFSPNNMLLDDGIYQCTIVCMVLSATPTYGWFVITD